MEKEMKSYTHASTNDLIFTGLGKKKNTVLLIETTFILDTTTDESSVTNCEAFIKSDSISNSLGEGTYKECYALCVAKKLELEPKVYNWKNCASFDGYFINISSGIRSGRIDPNNQNDRNCYPTKEDAESALAYCQLLHIVNKINEDYPKLEDQGLWSPSWDLERNEFYYIMNDNPDGGIKLNSIKAAEILIRDNEELLKTYFKIK